MEELKGAPDLLDLMVQPGFYVENFKIVQLNAAAEGLLLCPGMDIRPLIDSGLEEYASFQGGCLYLRLRLTQTAIGASIVKQNGMDVFLLDTQECDSALQALSLAARELRGPLAAITASADALQGEDVQLALLNRGIHQLLRCHATHCHTAVLHKLGDIPFDMRLGFGSIAVREQLAVLSGDMLLHLLQNTTEVIDFLLRGKK